MSNFKRLTIIVVTLLLAFVVTLQSVAAQNQVPGSGLSISPLHNDLALNPGESTKVEISLKNVTTSDVVAKAFILDFTSDNESGNPVITDQSKHNPYSIGKFIQNLENVPLKVGEKKTTEFTISVPQNTTPGAYYGIVRYQAIPAENAGEAGNGKVSLTASVGTLVLLEVKGNLVQKLHLNGIKAYKDNTEGTIFFNKPNKAGIELKNEGNNFAQPYGRVVVQDMFGNQVYSYEINSVQPRSTILPGSTRIFKDPIKNINKIGRYTITASVSYGNGSDVLVGKKSFWYIPVWLAIIIVAVILLLGYAIYFIVSRAGGYRRRGRKNNQ